MRPQSASDNSPTSAAATTAETPKSPAVALGPDTVASRSATPTRAGKAPLPGGGPGRQQDPKTPVQIRIGKDTTYVLGPVDKEG